MAKPGFSKEGGDEQYEFDVLPDSGSTDPVNGADRQVNRWQGRHEQGPVVFRYIKEDFRVWRFVWSGISTTFFDQIQKFNRLVRFWFYPDTSLPNEFRVRAMQNRLAIEQVSGKISTTMEIEHW